MGSRYKPIIRSTIPIEEEEVSEEVQVWRKAIGEDREVKEISTITGLDYHPITSDLLVTSNRIIMYDVYMDSKKSFYNSSPVAKYGACFRRTDGRLISVGSHSGKIFVYDSVSSKPLRELYDNKHKHTAAVRKSFFLQDHEIVSCGDDKCVKLWDLADGSLLKEFTDSDQPAHDDAVRTACVFDFNNRQLFATGSHDATVKLWDHRLAKPLTSMIKFDEKIESVTSRDQFLIVAANRTIIVYDLIGSKILKTLKNIHTKQITGLRTFKQNIFSSSLDGFCKIFSPSFHEILSLKHDASHLTSLAVDGNFIAVGTSDGLVTSRQLKSKFLAQSLYKSSGYGGELSGEKAGESSEKHFDVETVVVTKRKYTKPQLKEYDIALRKYRHAEALDAAMKEEDPCETVSLMQELLRRNRLNVALSRRQETPELDRIFEFVVSYFVDSLSSNLLTFTASFPLQIEYIRDFRFNRTLLDVTNALIDVYAGDLLDSPQILKHFTTLNQIINEEAELIIRMKLVAGQLDMIMANITVPA